MYMENKTIQAETNYFTRREDGQKCQVDVEEKSGEMKQKSARFYAFNEENYKAKAQLSREHPMANSIFEFFVSEMEKNTNSICVSMAVLEKIFKVDRRTIKRHIDILVKKDFVKIFKQGNMNVYAINAYVVWTKGDANIWKAKFKTTMYLDYDEQTKDIKAEFSKQIK